MRKRALVFMAAVFCLRAAAPATHGEGPATEERSPADAATGGQAIPGRAPAFRPRPTGDAHPGAFSASSLTKPAATNDPLANILKAVDFSPRPAFPVLDAQPLIFASLVRPEFRGRAAERGEADEPDIATMGPDWSGGVEVRATIDRTEFRQLQRIRVVMQFKNVSGHHLWEPPDGGNRYLGTRIRVFDVKGKLVPMTRYYQNEGRQYEVVGMSAGSCGSAFNPGQSSRIDVIANLVYDMTRPGEYWVLVEVPFGSYPARLGFEGLFYARARPIKVKVVPEPIHVLADRIDVPDPDRP